MKRLYPNHLRILKAKQLYWNYCTACVGVSEAGPQASTFLGNAWSIEYKLHSACEDIWKSSCCLLWPHFLYWHHTCTFTPGIHTRNMLSVSTIAVLAEAVIWKNNTTTTAVSRDVYTLNSYSQ